MIYAPLPDSLTNPYTPSAMYITQQEPYLTSIEHLVKISTPSIGVETVIAQAIKSDGYSIENTFKEKEDGNTFLLFTLLNTPDDFNEISYGIELLNKLDDKIPSNIFVNIL